jgi:hypothetical protein
MAASESHVCCRKFELGTYLEAADITLWRGGVTRHASRVLGHDSLINKPRPTSGGEHPGPQGPRLDAAYSYSAVRPPGEDTRRNSSCAQ